MNIIILGGEGQLAREFAAYFSAHHPEFSVSSLSERECDVTNAENVKEVLHRMRPNYVINTAAYHKVDECEDQTARTMETNAFGGYLVARVSRDVGARSMYFSTGYIFDGKKEAPYEEHDNPNPLNAYGRSKAVAERLIQEVDPRSWIIRTNGLFGRYSGAATKGGAGNFVDFVASSAKSQKKLDMVSDQLITPTSTADLVKACAELILENGKGGIMHLTNSGETSWFTVADTIYSFLGSKGKVNPITTKERASRAERPRNALLANTRWQRSGKTPLPHWEDAIKRYLSV